MLPSGDQATVKVRIDISFMGYNFKGAPQTQNWVKEKGEWFVKSDRAAVAKKSLYPAGKAEIDASLHIRSAQYLIPAVAVQIETADGAGISLRAELDERDPGCGLPETGCHFKHVIGPGIEVDGYNTPLHQIPVMIIGLDPHRYGQTMKDCRRRPRSTSSRRCPDSAAG